MKKEITVLFLLFFVASVSFGQEEKIHTNRGNKALQTGDYAEAEKAYKKALEVKPGYKEAQFNLGNTYQAQARALLEEASQLEDQQKQQEMLEQVTKLSASAAGAFEKVDATDDSEINKTQYNLGNSRIMTGEVDKSIESYKEALRSDPTDEDARYNLAYAQHLKKKQEEQQDQENQDQENQEENEEQQENQENQENKDQENENQQKDNQDKENQDQQKKQEQQQSQLSKEEAQKMLEALMRQEKDLQEKLNKKKQKGERIKIEKDW